MKSISANVPDDVLDHLKQVAAEEDRTLSAQVARILRQWVEEDSEIADDDDIAS
jgi:hypothetical protein